MCSNLQAVLTSRSSQFSRRRVDQPIGDVEGGQIHRRGDRPVSFSSGVMARTAITRIPSAASTDDR